jgi:hypothetical protein
MQPQHIFLYKRNQKISLWSWQGVGQLNSRHLHILIFWKIKVCTTYFRHLQHQACIYSSTKRSPGVQIPLHTEHTYRICLWASITEDSIEHNSIFRCTEQLHWQTSEKSVAINVTAIQKNHNTTPSALAHKKPIEDIQQHNYFDLFCKIQSVIHILALSADRWMTEVTYQCVSLRLSPPGMCHWLYRIAVQIML